MTDWKKLIEEKREEIEKAIADAAKKAAETGDRFTITLDWYGEVEIDQDPSHGIFDLGLTCNDIIEIAIIDFGTYQLTGEKEGRI